MLIIETFTQKSLIINSICRVDEAIKHIATLSQKDSDKKAPLRNVVEKQYLVKEKTQTNLLAHRSAVIAAATASASPGKQK